MKRALALILLGSWAWSQSVPSPASSPDPSTQQGQAGPTTELLPELPPPPGGKATLIGGTLSSLDRVRDEMIVRPFGGGKLRILFDGRTQVYRDGTKVSQRELRSGDRIYVDTLLDGTTIFAKNIRMQTKQTGGESRGQIVKYDQGTGTLTLKDALSSHSVNLRVTSSTRILHDSQVGTRADLVPGALVTVSFRASGKEPKEPGIVDEVSILAAPGTAFTFAGQVTYLDMPAGLLVLVDPRDKKSYEIHFDPARMKTDGELREGSEVNVTADFDGTRYVTKAVTVSAPVAE
jgi:hypothetical protein